MVNSSSLIQKVEFILVLVETYEKLKNKNFVQLCKHFNSSYICMSISNATIKY